RKVAKKVYDSVARSARPRNSKPAGCSCVHEKITIKGYSRAACVCRVRCSSSAGSENDVNAYVGRHVAVYAKCQSSQPRNGHITTHAQIQRFAVAELNRIGTRVFNIQVALDRVQKSAKVYNVALSRTVECHVSICIHPGAVGIYLRCIGESGK